MSNINVFIIHSSINNKCPDSILLSLKTCIYLSYLLY